MAWSIVQSASTAGTSGGITTTNVQLPNALSSGTVVLVAVASDTQTGSSTTVSTVTDSNGNSFALAGRKSQGSPILADISLWALATPAATIGITKPTFTATLGSGTAEISVMAQEVFGIQPATDGAAGVLGGNGSSGSTGSPSYTSSASNEYLVSVYGDDGGPLTWTKPAALTADAKSVNSSARANIAIAYGNSTHAAEAGSWAFTGSAADWGTILVAFKLSTTGPASGLLKTFL